jgi:membrane-associated protein
MSGLGQRVGLGWLPRLPGVDLLGWLSPEHIFANGGAWALWIVVAIIFAECGLLFGFFLPGDTLLFSTGVFVATGALDQPIWLVCLVLCVAAILGNLTGYEIGHKLGHAFLHGERRRFVQRRHIERTERFFERYGAPAIVLARFVGVVRTLITVVAGAVRMNRMRFFTYSAVGAVVWAVGTTLLGYFLGRIPFVRRHIEPHLDLMILIAVGFTVVAVAAHLLLDRFRTPTPADPAVPAGDRDAGDRVKDLGDAEDGWDLDEDGVTVPLDHSRPRS